jgi:hypothetical protein
MSVLPAGQSLTRFVPDLEDMVHDPRAYFAEGPLTIGPRQMYGLAGLFGIFGGALLASCFFIEPADRGRLLGERLALSIGFLLGAAVWLGWSLRLRGHSLVLRSEGMEIKFRDTVVWCPWAVFNVEGNAFVPGSDSPSVGLTLPISVDALPFVELRRDGTPVAHGAEIKAAQWYLVSVDTVVLPARYEVKTGELGELLLMLGRRLGRELPRGLPPPEAYPQAGRDDLPLTPDANGWITVHLTRLTFPPHCCSCGEWTQRTKNFTLDARAEKIMGVFVPAAQSLELAIPLCESCQQQVRDRQHRGGMNGMKIGSLLFTGLGMLLAWNEGWRERSLMLVVALAALSVGGIAGFLVGTLASRRLPVEMRGYSPSRGTLRKRFRHPEYAAQVLAAIRTQSNEHRP